MTAYLGADTRGWLDYDVTAVIGTKPSKHELLVDQGGNDPYLNQLRPDLLQKACHDSGQALTYRERPGYDHGYYFIASVIDDHLVHHARQLAG